MVSQHAPVVLDLRVEAVLALPGDVIKSIQLLVPLFQDFASLLELLFWWRCKLVGNLQLPAGGLDPEPPAGEDAVEAGFLRTVGSMAHRMKEGLLCVLVRARPRGPSIQPRMSAGLEMAEPRTHTTDNPIHQDVEGVPESKGDDEHFDGARSLRAAVRAVIAANRASESANATRAATSSV